MTTTTILVFAIAALFGMIAIVALMRALIKSEMGHEQQTQINRSVLSEDYYLDFTGPGHVLTRTTRATNLDHLEIKDAPEMTQKQKDYQENKRKKGHK